MRQPLRAVVGTRGGTRAAETRVVGGSLQERAHDRRRGTRQTVRAGLVHGVQLAERARAERRRGGARDAFVHESQSALGVRVRAFVPFPLPQQPLGVVAGELARGGHYTRRVREHERPVRAHRIIRRGGLRVYIDRSGRLSTRKASVRLFRLISDRVGGAVGERDGDFDAPLAHRLARGVAGQPRGGALKVARPEPVADPERTQQRPRVYVAELFRDEKQVRLERLGPSGGGGVREHGDVGGRREPGARPHPGRVGEDRRRRVHLVARRARQDGVRRGKRRVQCLRDAFGGAVLRVVLRQRRRERRHPRRGVTTAELEELRGDRRGGDGVPSETRRQSLVDGENLLVA